MENKYVIAIIIALILVTAGVFLAVGSMSKGPVIKAEINASSINSTENETNATVVVASDNSDDDDEDDDEMAIDDRDSDDWDDVETYPEDPESYEPEPTESDDLDDVIYY